MTTHTSSRRGTNYARGANLERLARDRLYQKGAYLVIRSAGSKGPIDLAGFFHDKILLIQVKGWTAKAEIRAREILASLPRCGNTIEVMIWQYRGKKDGWTEEDIPFENITRKEV